MKDKKIKIELDEKTAQVIGSILDGIIEGLTVEKEDKKEKIKIMDKLEELADTLDEKSEKFFNNEKNCTKENLEKLYNLFKQQEDFFDSVERKSNQ